MTAVFFLFSKEYVLDMVENTPCSNSRGVKDDLLAFEISIRYTCSTSFRKYLFQKECPHS